MQGNENKDRFAFGSNWSNFSNTIDLDALEEAKKGLLKLLPEEKIRGAEFLDIGCGSGLSSLAALALGAKKVVAFDYDKDSVKTTTELLTQYAKDSDWVCFQDDILNLSFEPQPFDIVYSWGVLHHTGDMQKAIHNAFQYVKPAGICCIALYGKTPLCWAWTIEKKLYNRMPLLRKPLTCLYKFLFSMAMTLSLRNMARYVKTYRGKRGMNWHHDVLDWLGGYPYESITPESMAVLAKNNHLKVSKQWVRKRSGLFGSGCDEYVLEPIDPIQ